MVYGTVLCTLPNYTLTITWLCLDQPGVSPALTSECSFLSLILFTLNCF